MSGHKLLSPKDIELIKEDDNVIVNIKQELEPLKIKQMQMISLIDIIKYRYVGVELDESILSSMKTDLLNTFNRLIINESIKIKDSDETDEEDVPAGKPFPHPFYRVSIFSEYDDNGDFEEYYYYNKDTAINVIKERMHDEATIDSTDDHFDEIVFSASYEKEYEINIHYQVEELYMNMD